MSVQITQFRHKNLRTEVIRKAVDTYRDAEAAVLESVARDDEGESYDQDEFEFVTERVRE